MSGRKRALRVWSAAFRLDVGAVVSELDPEGRLAIGAPRDEYAGTDRLVSLTVHGDLSETAIFAVWEKAFGRGSTLARRPDVLAGLTIALQKVRDERPSP